LPPAAKPLFEKRGLDPQKLLFIDASHVLVYNDRMKIIKTQTCNTNTNKILKYIRIGLSLVVIGLGIYYRNWIGALGLLTLYTAFTGRCGAALSFKRNDDPGVK